MSIHMVIVALLTILSHLVHIDYRSVQNVTLLLEEVVVDTSYFISFSLSIPPFPLTIDPSPPVLAPPFDQANAPTHAHTHSSATSTDPCVVSRSVDLVVCLALVVVSGILLGKAIEVSASHLVSPTQLSAREAQTPTIPIIPTEDASAPVLQALPSYNLSAIISVASSGSPLPPLTPVSPIHKPDALSASESSPPSPGLVSSSVVASVSNFLDDITLAISPSPSFIVKTPRPKVPRNLWEGFVDDDASKKSSVWDDFPRPLPRTPVVLFEEEAAQNIADGFEVVGRRHTHAVVKPLVRAWTMVDDTDVGEDWGCAAMDPRDRSSSSSLSHVGEVARAGPKLATEVPPTPVHYIPSASSPAPGPSSTPASAAAPIKSSTSKSKRAKKTKAKVDEKVTVKTEVKTQKKVSSAPVRVFEKCDCALQDGAFELSSWDEFKIPVSCRPRPTLHFFSPRDSDMANPTTRFVVDNINAFRHHSTEPNTPYVNEDIEAMFYFTGAKNVRCFDGRVVDGVVRYGVSYAVVDFDTVEDAIAVFRTFQGRKDYPDSFHLRLEFVDREDKSFGGRLSRAMGPVNRSEEEKKWFADFVEDMERVDVDLAKVPAPRPGFALPPTPAAFFVE